MPRSRSAADGSADPRLVQFLSATRPIPFPFIGRVSFGVSSIDNGDGILFCVFRRRSYETMIANISEVREALRMTVGRHGMSEESVGALADYLMSFFGFNTEVIDNRLDVDDRDVFYMLEEEGLLGTRQEEVFLKKGKLWRIHYWVLRTEQIKALARPNGSVVKARSDVYESLPAEAWARGSG